MKRLLFLTLLALAECRIIKSYNCDGVVLNGINHDKEILVKDVDAPYQLAIDHDTSTLFFSYSTEENGIFKSAFVNLKTKQFGTAKGVHRGFANAVDNVNKKVYIGGNDGIYEFDYATEQAINTNITKHNIWQLFYKDGLYHTTYPDESVYIYKNGHLKKVPELENTKAMLVAIDNDQNLIFQNSSGLFVRNKVDGIVESMGDYTLNGFATDIQGNVFFSTPNGIFSINKKRVEQLALIDEVYGLAVQADGSIIYASANSIVLLKSTGIECTTLLEKLKI